MKGGHGVSVEPESMSSSSKAGVLAGSVFSKAAWWGCLRVLFLLRWLLRWDPGLEGAPEVAKSSDG
jgi:hypothetical protein